MKSPWIVYRWFPDCLLIIHTTQATICYILCYEMNFSKVHYNPEVKINSNEGWKQIFWYLDFSGINYRNSGIQVHALIHSAMQSLLIWHPLWEQWYSYFPMVRSRVFECCKLWAMPCHSSIIATPANGFCIILCLQDFNKLFNSSFRSNEWDQKDISLTSRSMPAGRIYF